jgi:hypothetical protein
MSNRIAADHIRLKRGYEPPARAERDDENARPTVVAASVPATARPRYADRRAAAP